MTDCPQETSKNRLLDFHRELERAAKRYKERFQIPSSFPNSFFVAFCKKSREMEFELLDKLVRHIKSQDDMNEVNQKFVLGLIKGDLSVSDDRFENLVHLAQITKLSQDILS